jgi:hypothetical protein
MDSFNELPSEKRPPDLMIWDGSPEEIDSWLESVFNKKRDNKLEISIDKVE